MQVQANSMQYIYAQMQALMGSLASEVAGIAPPDGQDLPTGSANSSSSSTTAAATTAPPPAPTTPSSQFSSGLLSSLISLQSNPPSVSDVANAVISSVDTNGDGEISLSEFENALGGGSSNTASTSSASSSASSSAASTASAEDTVLAAGFAKLDTNGDGEISASELTTEIQKALQSTQSGADQTSQTEGAHHHHGGHHHHMEGSDPTSTDSTDTASSGGSTTTAGSSSSTGTGATTSTAAAILS